MRVKLPICSFFPRYSTITSISANNLTYSQYGLPVKKQKTEEEYFQDDEEEEAAGAAKSELPYIPAPGSPGPEEEEKEQKEDSDSEEDPLDAFMANLEKDAKSQGLRR